MSLAFWASDVCLVGVQSAVVALPGRTPLPGLERLARRLSSRWWALVPLASIAGVVFAIRAAAGTADGLTWLALVAIPPLAAATLGWTMRGARPLLAPLAAVLFALAWADRTGLAGEGAGVVLSALSCVTLGVLLVAVAPHAWLKVGIVLMASVDAALVTAQLLQPANDVLNAAAPPVGLPQLQRAVFGDALIGYGDLFIAGVFGALVAAEGGRQGRAALLVLALALAFELLFLVLSVLPATVPVALALVVREATRRRTARASAPGPEKDRNSRAATVSKR
jgi:hypothetical protein